MMNCAVTRLFQKVVYSGIKVFVYVIFKNVQIIVDYMLVEKNKKKYVYQYILLYI